MKLIDKDALTADIQTTIEESGCVNHEGEILDCIAYADEIDAVPVVRGEWILIGRGRITKSRDLKCSVCGNYFRVYDDVTLNAGRGDANFCPNCGAHMIGGENDATD